MRILRSREAKYQGPIGTEPRLEGRPSNFTSRTLSLHQVQLYLPYLWYNVYSYREESLNNAGSYLSCLPHHLSWSSLQPCEVGTTGFFLSLFHRWGNWGSAICPRPQPSVRLQIGEAGLCWVRHKGFPLYCCSPLTSYAEGTLSLKRWWADWAEHSWMGLTFEGDLWHIFEFFSFKNHDIKRNRVSPLSYHPHQPLGYVTRLELDLESRGVAGDLRDQSFGLLPSFEDLTPPSPKFVII